MEWLLKRMGVNVLVRNSRATATNLSTQGFLDLHPDGVYTSSRIYKGKYVFALESHVKRLIENCNALYSSTIDSTPEILRVSVDALKMQVLSDVRCGLKIAKRETMRSTGKDEDEGCDYKMTMVLIADGEFKQPRLELHLAELAPQLDNNIKVNTVYGCRNDPLVKTIKWSSVRKEHEKHWTDDVCESILMNEDGSITEGTASNFFVIKNESVYSAPIEKVLPGVMRSIVISSLRELGIPFHEESPQIKEIDEWDACFVSSSVRGIRFVSSLVSKEDGKAVQFNRQNCPLFSAVYAKAMEICQQKAELIC